MKHRTRWAAFVAALALVAAACTSAAGTGSETTAGETSNAGSAQPAGGDPAPTAAFELFDGSTTSFAAYAGQPLVVNFWASWCPSCVAEMSAAFRPAQEQLGDQVAFVGLNTQDERAKAVQLAEETGVLFDLAEDPRGDLYIELGGIGMPFTVFIDADGQIVEKHNGPLNEAQLVDMIEELLLT